MNEIRRSLRRRSGQVGPRPQSLCPLALGVVRCWGPMRPAVAVGERGPGGGVGGPWCPAVAGRDSCPQNRRSPFREGGRRGRLPLLPRPPSEGSPPLPTLEPISISYGGLLTRLDILVNLVADRRGLALDLQGRLAAAEVRLLAEALELDRSPGPVPRDLAAVELLRGLAEAIGLLRDRGDRVEATTLRHPWAQLDVDLRAGLVYAAWCHRVPW